MPCFCDASETTFFTSHETRRNRTLLIGDTLLRNCNWMTHTHTGACERMFDSFEVFCSHCRSLHRRNRKEAQANDGVCEKEAKAKANTGKPRERENEDEIDTFAGGREPCDAIVRRNNSQMMGMG